MQSMVPPRPISSCERPAYIVTVTASAGDVTDMWAVACIMSLRRISVSRPYLYVISGVPSIISVFSPSRRIVVAEGVVITDDVACYVGCGGVRRPVTNCRHGNGGVKFTHPL